MKISLYDTNVMRNARVKEQITKMTEFAVTNRQNFIIKNEEFRSLVSAVRMIHSSPMAEFFNSIVSSNALNDFAIMYAKNTKTQALPEILTSPSIVIDFKEAKLQALNSIPELNDKLLVNITGTIRSDNATSFVSDIDTLQSLIVKAHLTGTYHDSDNNQGTWLPIRSLDFLVKSYSMVLSSTISKSFNCTVPETFAITRAFALYISQRLTGAIEKPIYFLRSTWAGSPRELEDVLKLATELGIVYNCMNVEELCKLIAAMVGGRLEKLNPAVYISCCGHLGQDTITSLTALEYPPYWAYLLYKSMSAKTWLTYELNKQKLIKPSVTEFFAPIQHHDSLFKSARG